MIYIAIALLIIGSLFLFAEAFIPGFGFFGISGIILLLISFFITFTSVKYGVFFLVAEIAILCCFVFAMFKYSIGKQLYGKLILHETLHFDKHQSDNLNYLMGKVGYTKTPLKPFGLADFNGLELEVCSDCGYINSKEKIKIINLSQHKITVKQIEQDTIHNKNQNN